MGEGSVTQPPLNRRPSWRLAPPDDTRTQGVVVSGFSDLPWAEALFLYAKDSGAAWINALKGGRPNHQRGRKGKGSARGRPCVHLHRAGERGFAV